MDHLSCSACGTRFRSMVAEARHRHNFPALCKRNASFRRWEAERAVERRIEAAFRAGFSYGWDAKERTWVDQEAAESHYLREFLRGGIR